MAKQTIWVLKDIAAKLKLKNKIGVEGAYKLSSDSLVDSAPLSHWVLTIYRDIQERSEHTKDFPFKDYQSYDTYEEADKSFVVKLTDPKGRIK